MTDDSTRPVHNTFYTFMQLVHAGSFIARPTQIIDLGTQSEVYQEKATTKRKLWIAFEFPTLTKKDGSTYFATYGKEFIYYMGKTGRLTQFLQGWFGREFTDEELDKIKFASLQKWANRCATITLDPYTPKGKPGETAYSIGAIKALDKTVAVPDRQNAFQFLNLEDAELDHTTFSAIPGFLQKKIRESPEYARLTGRGLTQTEEPSFADIDNSDLPF